MGGAERPDRLDEVALTDAEHAASRDAGVADPPRKGEHGDQVSDPGAEDGHDREAEENRWKRELDVRDAHQEIVPHTAVVSAEDSDERPEGGGQHDGARPDEERHAGAVDDAAENIPSELVRPEPIHVSRAPRKRRGEAVDDILTVRIHRHQMGGQQGQDADRSEQDKT